MSKRVRSLLVWALVAGLGVAQASDAQAQGASVAAATDEQKQAAQDAFLQALDKSKAGDHEGALAGFRASFAIVESPNTHLMIGRELAALGRVAEAYRAIRAAEKLAQDASTVDAKYVDAAKAAALEAEDMKSRVGMLRLDLGDLVALEISVQGQSIPLEQRGEPIAVDPGKVPVIVRTSKGVETREVDAMAGSESVVDFKPAAPPPPPPEDGSGFNPFDGGSDQRTTAYIAGGVGAAGMVLFGVFGAMHLSTFGDLEDQCPGNVCPASAQGDVDSGKTYQTVANVGLVVGAVGLAAGTALFVTTLGGDDGEASASSAPPLQLGFGPTGVSLRGSF